MTKISIKKEEYFDRKIKKHFPLFTALANQDWFYWGEIQKDNQGKYTNKEAFSTKSFL